MKFPINLPKKTHVCNDTRTLWDVMEFFKKKLTQFQTHITSTQLPRLHENVSEVHSKYKNTFRKLIYNVTISITLMKD